MGHRDGGNIFLNELWYSRALGFALNELPLPDTTGLEEKFWERFKFSKNTTLYYADSHARIYNEEIYKNISETYSFDAHHDCGYSNPNNEVERKEHLQHWLAVGQVSCQDWAIAYELIHNIRVKVFYPKWKVKDFKCKPAKLEVNPIIPIEMFEDDEKPVINKKFDRIFLCRSGGWTPSWLDAKFDKFVESCPVKTKISLDGLKNRDFSQERMEREFERTKTMIDLVGKR